MAQWIKIPELEVETEYFTATKLLAGEATYAAHQLGFSVSYELMEDDMYEITQKMIDEIQEHRIRFMEGSNEQLLTDPFTGTNEEPGEET